MDQKDMFIIFPICCFAIMSKTFTKFVSDLLYGAGKILSMAFSIVFYSDLVVGAPDNTSNPFPAYPTDKSSHLDIILSLPFAPLYGYFCNIRYSTTSSIILIPLMILYISPYYTTVYVYLITFFILSNRTYSEGKKNTTISTISTAEISDDEDVLSDDSDNEDVLSDDEDVGTTEYEDVIPTEIYSRWNPRRSRRLAEKMCRA